MPNEGFVNPYTFIPIGEVRRTKPLGHNPTATQAAERYVGSFTVTWQIKTPLACPAATADRPAEWGTPSTTLRVPGSSMKGSVRTTHELLFGGCLRQLDTEFRPIYRELPMPDVMRGYQLGIVTVSPRDDGTECRVKVLDTRDSNGKIYSVEATALKDALGRAPDDGEIVHMNLANPAGTQRQSNRIDLTPSPSQGHGTPFYVHITHEAARNRRHPVYWALGKVDGATEYEVTPEVLREFRWRAKDSRSIGSPHGPNDAHGNQMFRVDRDGFIGRRKDTGAKDLGVGHMVWVRLDGGVITEIKRSQIWRRRADGQTLGERLPRESHPCTGKDGLCLSCQVFGAADTTGPDGEGRATQHSYSGHVRLGPAILQGTQPDEVVRLAPLGQPHPGAGMMYLAKDLSFQEPRDSADRKNRWDVKGDQRALRGRKAYWFADPDKQRDRLRQIFGLPANAPLRYLKRGHHGDDTTTDALLVRSGTLTQTVTFDGLDRTSLISLLAAFEPGRVLAGTDFALHLGRGKPLGLGAMVATVQDFRATTVAERYTAAPHTLALAHFAATPQDKDALRQRCGDQTAPHQAAKKVLSLTGLGDDEARVTYPATESWRQYGTEAFDKSFTFFKDYGGPAERQQGMTVWKSGRYIPMPEATDASQLMRTEDAQ